MESVKVREHELRARCGLETLNQISATVIGGADAMFGWLLLLPRDATLLVFAALTALLMTLARRRSRTKTCCGAAQKTCGN